MFSIQVSTKYHLLQSYYTIVKLAAYTQGVHIKVWHIRLSFILHLFKTKLNENDCVNEYFISYKLQEIIDNIFILTDGLLTQKGEEAFIFFQRGWGNELVSKSKLETKSCYKLTYIMR